MKDNDTPLVLREIYAHCGKYGVSSPRIIRSHVERSVHEGFVDKLKCPCKHSSMYILKTHLPKVKKHGYTIIYKL